MYKVSDYLSSYNRMDREALIYQLLNMYDSGTVQNGVSNRLTVNAKQRLRNRIIANAYNIITANEMPGMDIDSPDVIIRAFKNVVGQIAPYKDNMKQISQDMASAKSPVRTTIMNDIESWHDTDMALVSPYDSMFASNRLFSDEHDSMGYVPVNMSMPDSVMNLIYFNNEQALQNYSKSSEIRQGEGTSLDDIYETSGFSSISHFIKKDNYAKVRDFMTSQTSRAVTNSDREFMHSVCAMMSAQGFDYDIIAKDNSVTLKMSDKSEIRLFDVSSAKYDGRILDKGITAYLSVRESNRAASNNTDLFSQYVDNEDKLNAIRWYFGINDGSKSNVRELHSHMISRTLKIGSYQVFNNADGRSSAARPNLITVSAGSGTGTDSKGSVLLKAVGYGMPYANAVRLRIGASSSSRSNSSDMLFSKSVSPFTASDINSNVHNTGSYNWRVFLKNDLPDEYVAVGDSISLDDNNIATMSMSDESHAHYYECLPAYFHLASWINSAKDRHRSLMNIDGLIDDFNRYRIDPTHSPASTGDDDVDELRAFCWKIFTGKITSHTVTSDMDGLDMEKLASRDINDKIAFVNAYYDKYQEDNFGEIPDIQIPGKPPVNNTGKAFNPEQVARYTIADDSLGRMNNQACIKHMLMKLDDYYSPDWIKGNTFVGNQIENDLIKYDSSNEIGAFNLKSVIDMYNSRNSKTVDKVIRDNPKLASKPVTVDMMLTVGEAMLHSGFDPASIRLSIDNQGIIKYTGEQYTSHSYKNVDKSSADQRGSLDSIRMPKTGYIGQIFEPDEFGVIDPQYVVNGDTVCVPGYRTYLTEQDPDHPLPLRKRLRGVSWKMQMKQQINKEIHRAAFQMPVEYNFTPHATSLNSIYSHSYTSARSREAYFEHKAAYAVAPDDPENITYFNSVKTEGERCRFPNEYGDGASTMAQSMLEHPNKNESKTYDYYYSDLFDNHNIRVLDESFDGIFDADATGTAKTQGVVRYLADGATFDDDTGEAVAVPGFDYSNYDRNHTPQCALMKDSIMKYKDNDSADRRIMTFNNMLTSWHTPRNAGTAMMNIDGFAFDDGIIVSKKFAEKYQVKDTDGNSRPLIAQDKLCDMHGNKGVISFVVDPDMTVDGIVSELGSDLDGYAPGTSIDILWDEAKDIKYRVTFDPKSKDSNVIQAAHQIQKQLGINGLDDVMKVFHDNPDLDVVMSPYSGMSRANGGSLVTLLDRSDPDKNTLHLADKDVKGGISNTDLIVVDMLADVKTHLYDDDAVMEGKGRKASGQLAWALQSKGAIDIMREFYGNNDRAFNDLREYAIAIGLDFDKNFKPLVGYHAQTERNEKRKLIKMPETIDTSVLNVSSVGGRSVYNMTDEAYHKLSNAVMRELNASGGFMELPFALKFNTLDNASVVNKKNIPDDLFNIQATGQTYVDCNGKEQTTYGMPVLPSNLRITQTFQDDVPKLHDYTQRYINIYRDAYMYRAIQQDAIESQAKIDDIDAKDAVLANLSASEKASVTYTIKAFKNNPETVVTGQEAVDYQRKCLKRDKTALEKHIAAASVPNVLQKYIDSAQANFNGITKEIAENQFKGKHNIIRDEVMVKRLANSGTAVWSADPRLKSDEIAMPMKNAEALGLAMRDKDTGEECLRKSARVLVWRDPILHDGNLRYMKVVIDNRLTGCAINPLMDASFDGDFDGDSVAIVALQTLAANRQAYYKFSIESNLLNYGVKQEITNPVTGEKMMGHPLYIQTGLDTASLMYNNPELINRRAMLEYNINNTESIYKQIEEHKLPETALKAQRKDVDGNTVCVTGHKALDVLRTHYKHELDAWMHDSLNGIGQDIIRTDSAKSVVESLQHIVDDGAKGSASKMKDLCDNMGISYDVDDKTRAISDTVKILSGTDKYIAKGQLDKSQRDTDKAIQETMAYKADNTALGGMNSQQGVSAFRDKDMKAILELTYPITQAILQSKHDPKDAKIKDEIVRFWGKDCWNGYKLTGNWSDDTPLEDLQNTAHNRQLVDVINPDTMQRMHVYRDKCEQPDEYECTFAKCTRSEWIQQMKGMMRALKVDDSINPDYIKKLADIMYDSNCQDHDQITSALTGYVISYKKDGTRVPVTCTNDDRITGVAGYNAKHSSLLDCMAYSGGSDVAAGASRLNGLLNYSLMSCDAYKQTLPSYVNNRCDLSVIDNASENSSDIKQHEIQMSFLRQQINDAACDDKPLLKQQYQDEKLKYQDACSSLSNSGMFGASLVDNLYCDDVVAKTGSAAVLPVCRRGQTFMVEKLPQPVGNKHVFLSADDYDEGQAFMGESQTDYAKRHTEAVLAQTEKEEIMQQQLAEQKIADQNDYGETVDSDLGINSKDMSKPRVADTNLPSNH